MRWLEPRAEEVARIHPDAPVVGFRAWRGGPVGDPPCLHSMHRPVRWRPASPFRGMCLPSIEGVPPVHPEPVRGCTCGVYAFGSHQALERYLGRAGESPSVCGREAFYVAGVILAWGTVVIGPGGWRAEWCRPALLLAWPLRCRPALHEGAAEWIASAAERYAVPLALDWPEDLPRSIRPRATSG